MTYFLEQELKQSINLDINKLDQIIITQPWTLQSLQGLCNNQRNNLS